MARLAGIVQGVVVQMTTQSSFTARTGRSAETSSYSLNITKIEGEVWSAYSTSASARAVTHDEHQCTGFLPDKVPHYGQTWQARQQSDPHIHSSWSDTDYPSHPERRAF